MSKITPEEIRAQLQAKWHEIAALVAAQLGYGPVESLSPTERESLKQEVETVIDNWNEADVASNTGGLHPVTDLQKALSEYLSIFEDHADLFEGREYDDEDHE